MSLANNFTLVFAVISCFVICTNSQNDIVNDRKVQVSADSHMVEINYNGQHSCAGSLVNLKVVITTERCVKDTNISKMSVLAGAPKARQRRAVDRKYVSPNQAVDVGALTVKQPFAKSAAVSSIPLCNSKLTPNTKMRVSQWGAGSKEPSNLVKDGVLSIAPNSACEAGFRNLRKTIGSKRLKKTKASQRLKKTKTSGTPMICDGNGKAGSCIGDSGKAGVVNGHLCAVVSLGRGCGNPGVYTDLNNPQVRKFIENVMAK